MTTTTVEKKQKPPIGRVINLLRTFSDISQTEMAKRCNISVTLLSLMESGKRTPSLAMLQRFARVLDIPPSVFWMIADDCDDLKTENEFVLKMLDVLYEYLDKEQELKDLLLVAKKRNSW